MSDRRPHPRLLPWLALPLIVHIGGCGSGSAADGGVPTDARTDAEPSMDAGIEDVGVADVGGFDAGACSMTDIPTTPGRHCRLMEHDGLDRRYLLWIPDGYDGSVPAPVVFWFHGGGLDPLQAERNHFVEQGNAAGMIVIASFGIGATWNAIHCCERAFTDNVDDVGFVRALLTALSGSLAVDAARVYASGNSNGGMITHRLASEASDLFAAVAPSAATIGGSPDGVMPERRITPPPEPLPIMLLHGLLDTTVQFEGGESSSPSTREDIGFRESVTFWVDANGCDSMPAVTMTPAWGTIEGFGGCNGRAEVVAVVGDEVMHAFPLPSRPGGYDATRVIMQFFARHARP